MKNAMLKNAFVEIKKTKSRFLSIFCIVAMGVGFFTGISATSTDMRLSADTYYDNYNLMDFRLVSTYGFDDNDIKAIEQLSIAKKVYPSYSIDSLIHQENGDKVARVYSMDNMGENNDVNKLHLTEGRFPEKENECVVEAGNIEDIYDIGDTVTLQSENAEEDLSETIKNQTYTIVGKVNTPLYISEQRGSTTVGNGSVSILVFIAESNFTIDYYTQVYITIDELKAMESYGEEYKDKITGLAEKFEEVGDTRKEARFEDIIKEANEKISDSEKELKEGKEKQQKELSDAQKKLDYAKIELDKAEAELADGKTQLEDGKKTLDESLKKLSDAKAELEKGKKEFDEKMADAKKQLDDSEKKLADADAEYKAGLKMYKEGLSAYNDGLKQYEAGVTKYNLNKAEYDKSYQLFLAGKTEYNTNLANYNSYISSKKQYEQGIALYNSGLDEYQKNLSAYEYAVNNGLISEEEAAQQKALLDTAKAELDATKTKLDNVKKILDQMAPEIEGAGEKLAAAKKQLDETEKLLADGKKQLDSGKTTLDETGAVLSASKKTLDESDTKLKAAEKQITEGKAQLSEGKAQYEKGYAEGKSKLSEGEKQYNEGKEAYESGLSTYNENLKKYNDGVEEFEKGKKEYQQGLIDFKTGKEDSDKEIKDGEEKIQEAKDKLLDLEKPVWYVFDREDNPAYTEYDQNADRINNISKIFPVFFLLVAGLVCLTTMTRMVEEQRTQIGTLKALGYKNSSIMFKYMLYAIVATLAGAFGGILFGQQLFPQIIIYSYGMMYKIPDAITPYMAGISLSSIGVCIVAIVITVYFACKNILKEVPAELMRPKTPKTGKRIFLERIGFIWNRFNFTKKVCARNIFRYKKRMLMTVIGVAGCTALVLTGFGLYDSIKDIAVNQFQQVSLYDGTVVYNNEKIDDRQLAAIDKTMSDYKLSSIKAHQKQVSVKANDKNNEAYIVSIDDTESISKFIAFKDRVSGEKYALDDEGVIIDEKLSTLMNLSVGDKITLYKTETQTAEVKISAITENYAQHYVYITHNLYNQLFGETPEYNTIYYSGDLTEEQENSLSVEILKNKDVMTVLIKEQTAKTFTDMTETLALVVVVLIASAGALAFIVLFNLTNININERIREIATLKVLGFYDREVSSYIFREIIIITLMGTGAGLLLGKWLTSFVVSTAEVDLVMFGRNIYPTSYILSIVITVVFSLLVSLIMHRHLMKVSMVESLKSVE